MLVVHNTTCTNWLPIKSIFFFFFFSFNVSSVIISFYMQFFGPLFLHDYAKNKFISCVFLSLRRTVRCRFFFCSTLKCAAAVRANNQHVCESSINCFFKCLMIMAFIFIMLFLCSLVLLFFPFTILFLYMNNKKKPGPCFFLLSFFLSLFCY